MKKFFLNTVMLVSFSTFLAGCGGGGGAPAPKTQGSVAIYLFGTMSSSSKVASIESKFTVPSGIMVNYSSPPGVNTGIHPLHSGSIVPSGLSVFSKDDFSTAYDIDNQMLTVGVVNKQMINIQSNVIGNGLEIATLSFKLTTPDVFPVLPTPWQDPAAVVFQNTLSVDTVVKTGLTLKFITSFFP